MAKQSKSDDKRALGCVVIEIILKSALTAPRNNTGTTTKRSILNHKLNAKVCTCIYNSRIDFE